MSGPFEVEVPDALDGQRVDRAVAMLTGCTRAEALKLVVDGAVVMNGRRIVRGSHRLVVGATLAIDVPTEVEAAPMMPDADVDFGVVYSDPDVIVVDKPAGLVVHPGAGSATGTLAQGLLDRFPEIATIGDPDRPGIVHRLDRGTSGLLVVARSADAYEALVVMMAAHDVERQYLAVAWGHVESDRGVVDAPLGRSKRQPMRQAVVTGGREARTHYRVERRALEPASVTVLDCHLETGRTHQIRVHLSAIGHPIVGDDRYGGVRDGITFGRPALHAAGLGFDHPVTGEKLRFDAPPPKDLTELLESLR